MNLNPFPAVGRGMAAFTGWVHRAICALVDPEGRKGWAMLAALGCSVAMTAYAVAAMWLVKKNPMLVFWLGLSAMVIIFTVITGLMVLLGIRRSTDVDLKEGKVKITDAGPSSLNGEDQGPVQ